MKHALCTCLVIVIAACGGGEPRTPDGQGARSKERSESIGDAVAAQGGLASLGGAGNREDGSTGVEVALGAPLHAEDVDSKTPVKLDGVLKEWPARYTATQPLAGRTDGLGLAVAVQTDETKLYVGVEITDPALARSPKHGEGEDHVTMTLAFPAGRGGLKGYELGFFAGKPGESAGVVKWLAGPSKGQEVAGAKIVESDVKGGFAFEAAVPWSAFAEARTMRVGLRAAFRYHDGDGSSIRGVLGTGPGSVDRPGDLPALPSPQRAKRGSCCRGAPYARARSGSTRGSSRRAGRSRRESRARRARPRAPPRVLRPRATCPRPPWARAATSRIR